MTNCQGRTRAPRRRVTARAVGRPLGALRSAALGLLGSLALAAANCAPDRSTAEPERSAAEAERSAAETEPISPAARPAHWPGFPLLPDGGFPIAGWCTPPLRETTRERLAEYRDAGFTVLLPALEDPYLEPGNRRRLDIASQTGLWAIVRDDRVHPDEALRPGWESRVRATVEAYGGHPALLGYFLADEPGPPVYASLEALTQLYARLDARHPAYTNLLGLSPAGLGHGGRTYRAYLEGFLEAARPAFFSVDLYSLRIAGDTPNFCAGLDSARIAAERFECPFWAILQLTPHVDMRDLTTSELRWQAHLALAHGAKGIVWFTYWTPRPDESNYRDGPIDYEGRRKPAYQRVRRVNRDIQALGRAIGPRPAYDVRHGGTMPRGGRALDGTQPILELSGGEFTAGFFAAPGGAVERDTLALVVARDYRLTSRARVSWRGAAERWEAESASWRPLASSPAAFEMEPGGALLLRFAARESGR